MQQEIPRAPKIDGLSNAFGVLRHAELPSDFLEISQEAAQPPTNRTPSADKKLTNCHPSMLFVREVSPWFFVIPQRCSTTTLGDPGFCCVSNSRLPSEMPAGNVMSVFDIDLIERDGAANRRKKTIEVHIGWRSAKHARKNFSRSMAPVYSPSRGADVWRVGLPVPHHVGKGVRCSRQ